MPFPKHLIWFALTALSLAACAPQQARLAATPPAPAAKSDWAFETSDIPLDPAWRFGKLDNGMRYIVRSNATPAGTGAVRMEIAAGSLDEAESERGFAHFVEHMAFNGSTRVPEGEMVRLLEREGLAFGADTNAQTSFDRTTYMLNLPRNDAALLDTALMLMRETASELTISPEAVARERGVVLSEMRDRNSWQLRALENRIGFFNPGSRYAARMPIGTEATLEGATADSLKAFWRREYVPAQTTVIVVGDFDADRAEAAVRAHFASWAAAPIEDQPSAGPVLPADKGRTANYINPALSERVYASRNGAWLDEPDSVAQRQENLLRQIGYSAINRRLLRITRQENPPFRGAGFGTGDVFKAGRTTNLVVDTVDGKWRRGLLAVAQEYRRAMRFGFSDAEVAEQLANLRASAENAARSADTRENGELLGAALALVRDGVVPGAPADSLARFETFAPQITPQRVLAALKREAVELDAPLILMQGRTAPKGGNPALRAAWDEAMRQPLSAASEQHASGFAYSDFGSVGTVISDSREPELGIREIRFANGVRLNLRQTDLDKDKIQLQVSIDGGRMLDTRTNPTATDMASVLTEGGLGKHSRDELQSLLAGKSVGFGFSAGSETFVSRAETTPRDLELQLQVLTALVSDPGFRREGEVRYRLNINNFFAQSRATPQAALSNAIGGILSDQDPRFTLQPVETYRQLSFERFKADIGAQLAHGAIEIGIVGDIDEDATIALVARTFGALPAREAAFRDWSDNRSRPFTADRSPRTVRHTGPANQALLRLTWPTRDDSDATEALALELLERVVRIELTETLREKLGKAYSPSAASTPSRTWRGYGEFGIAASVDVREVAAARTAIAETIARLREAPVSPDELLRARRPLLETWDNALKSNRGWLALVDRAQTEADRIARFQQTRTLLEAVTPEQVQTLARRYLAPDAAVEVLVLPEGITPP